MTDGTAPASAKDFGTNLIDAWENQSKEFKVSLNGVFCGTMIEPTPAFYQADCEKVIKGQNSSYIVLGRDRVNSMQSGYGGTGAVQSSMIDLVVGRMGSEGNKSQDEDGEDIYCNPSFTKDAARIYISQKTDIDDNFSLAAGKVGLSKSRSAIAMKADAVRIIGREGIKLITRGDRKNSRGGDISIVKGVELIAGNDDSDLQPIPRGKNLATALIAITEEINRLNAVVGDIIMILMAFHTQMSAHTHALPPTPVMIPTPAGPAPLASTVPGFTAPSPQAASAASVSVTGLAQKCMQGVVAQKQNLVFKQKTYLEPAGSKYINSRFNKVN